jgi:hypothetical protein
VAGWEESSFSEEKEAKRLLFCGGSRQPEVHCCDREARTKIFFASFFFRGFNSEMHSE